MDIQVTLVSQDILVLAFLVIQDILASADTQEFQVILELVVTLASLVILDTLA